MANDTKIIRSGEQPTMLMLPKCKIVVTDKNEKASTHEIDKGRILIGGAETCDLQIKDDTVSRQHAEIIKMKEGYLIRDLDSTNGTYVGGLKIKEAYLSPQSIIKIGKSSIQFTPQDQELEIYPSKNDHYAGLIGKSLGMRKIFGVLDKVSPTNVSVVITGETGTGKELVAKAIHDTSKRNKAPFIVFDCGAVAENLIESELFGHEKGSFTGATATRQGAFELADGGTLFLDELGELSIDLQPKLLRALESGDIKRVGADRSKKVNVRVVAATNRNLKEEVKKGNFREDLYFRLSVVEVHLPALRKRKDDIKLLIDHFFELAKSDNPDKKIISIGHDAKQLLENYAWPGNIRELKNAIDRAMSFCEGHEVMVEHLPDYITGGSAGGDTNTGFSVASGSSVDSDLPFKEAKERWVESFEKDYLIDLLKKNDLNISKAAKQAGIDRKSVQRLLKKYDLNVKDL
ncbi:MAG TPA: sigma 54-interacting transcriptional regulator [Oligoflexia bacterium]|nr:sigma 54-interacting transcriptional regulator [Oligoflexia bacterium]